MLTNLIKLAWKVKPYQIILPITSYKLCEILQKEGRLYKLLAESLFQEQEFQTWSIYEDITEKIHIISIKT